MKLGNQIKKNKVIKNVKQYKIIFALKRFHFRIIILKLFSIKDSFESFTSFGMLQTLNISNTNLLSTVLDFTIENGSEFNFLLKNFDNFREGRKIKKS